MIWELVINPIKKNSVTRNGKYWPEWQWRICLLAYPQISVGIEPGVERWPGYNRLLVVNDVNKIRGMISPGKSQGKYY